MLLKVPSVSGGEDTHQMCLRFPAIRGLVCKYLGDKVAGVGSLADSIKFVLSPEGFLSRAPVCEGEQEGPLGHQRGVIVFLAERALLSAPVIEKACSAPSQRFSQAT